MSVYTQWADTKTVPPTPFVTNVRVHSVNRNPCTLFVTNVNAVHSVCRYGNSIAHTVCHKCPCTLSQQIPMHIVTNVSVHAVRPAESCTLTKGKLAESCTMTKGKLADSCTMTKGKLAESCTLTKAKLAESCTLTKAKLAESCTLTKGKLAESCTLTKAKLAESCKWQKPSFLSAVNDKRQACWKLYHYKSQAT